jgi:hypothetical protein
MKRLPNSPFSEKERGAMFLPAHYVCDVCQRVLESEDERYVFRAGTKAETLDPEIEQGKIDTDRDYLQEIDDLLTRGGDLEIAPSTDVVESPSEYRLCLECRQRFVPDSLDRRKSPQLDFSGR